MERNDRTITINEVAEEAGVSITTVSRVLNNNYPVKRETRERVEKAVEKLRYTPNVIARGLIMKKTSVIGVVVPGLTNLFFPTIVEAIDNVTKLKGYTISLNNTSGDPKLERELINKIISMQVDGIIVIDPAAENLDNKFYDNASLRLPIIVVNANSSRANLNYISYNEEIGTTEAFEYLVGLGHKRIIFLRGESSFSYDIKEKVYLSIIEKHKLNYKKIVKVKHGNTIEGAAEADARIKELFQAKDNATAVFACNDVMAVGVMGAYSDLGLKVPQDISVIGSDNILLSKISYPKLTTIDLKMDLVGKKAAEEMLNMIENKLDYRIKVVLKTSLIIRDSCFQVNNQ
ncbi:MAG: lacI [Clostridiales bacterium]|jgi:LacI family transcriptional regulator|nr:lacI [Clostridiales bacterium]